MEKEYISVNSYKGTRDFYPEDMAYRNWFFAKVKSVIESYGYEEYNAPLLESFELYAAKSGEEIAGEQLYTFEDKGGRRLAIRPEMTPSVARLVASRLETLAIPLRWFSIANFMRYERPQKGRLREHWQVNVDIFGSDRIEAELEIVSIIRSVMTAFGANTSMFRIRINNRKFFNDVLVHILGASPESVKTISKAVDKRAKIPKESYDAWLSEQGISPQQIRLLDEIFTSPYEAIKSRLPKESEGVTELDALFGLLEKTGLREICEFDFSIVRGFDYYTGTVFEVYDASPENKRSLFGGGRYDNLISMFRHDAVSGIGFGLGDVTFEHFLAVHGLIPDEIFARAGVYIVRFPEVPIDAYYAIASGLRDAGINVCIHLEAGDKLGKQVGFAEKKKFPVVLIAGPDEVAENKVAVKHLGTKSQHILSQSEYVEKIKELLAKK